jgi:glycosyltransferase involved in cell wall biosynthesis
MKTAILIPVFEPNEKLIELIQSLIPLDFPLIMVVNDGSDKKCIEIFRFIEGLPKCKVVHHENNLGKGAALKTGMKQILNTNSHLLGCITVDGDGQHLPEDVEKVTRVFEKNSNSIVLGCRDFSDKNVPSKSKMGNLITRTVFMIITNKIISDTQTGLRAIPIDVMQEFQDLPGSHYEYEMNFLFHAAKRNIPMTEQTIQTVYLNQNKSSHFKPFLDSVRIYKNVFKFSISSLCCSIVDIGLFALIFNLISLNGSSWALFGATIFARIASSTLNFLINKKIVFKSSGSALVQTIKYYSLSVIQILSSWLLLKGLTSIFNQNVVLLKMMVDIFLFFASFIVQRMFIFKRRSLNESKI